jgi:hypothetical protein
MVRQAIINIFSSLTNPVRVDAVGTTSQPVINEVGDRLDVTTSEDCLNLSVTPTITAGAYHANDVIGGKQTLTSVMRANGGYADLDCLTVIDKSGQAKRLQIVFFDSDPTVGTYTDNGAPTFSTDLAKIVGTLLFRDVEYVMTVNGMAMGTISEVGLQLKSAAATRNLYFIVTTPDTPTYGSTSDLILLFGFKQKN